MHSKEETDAGTAEESHSQTTEVLPSSFTRKQILVKSRQHRSGSEPRPRAKLHAHQVQQHVCFNSTTVFKLTKPFRLTPTHLSPVWKPARDEVTNKNTKMDDYFEINSNISCSRI